LDDELELLEDEELLVTTGIELEAVEDVLVIVGVLVVEDANTDEDTDVVLLGVTVLVLVVGGGLVVVLEEPMYEALSRDCIFSEPK